MADISSYSHDVTLSVPIASANKVWSGLTSWKGYLASFTGLLTVRTAGRVLDNGDLRLRISTIWEYESQLDEWMASDMTPRHLFGDVQPAVYDVVDEIYENLD